VPALLEEGDQEVLSHGDVLSQLFLSHILVTDSDGEASHLLQLELDGSSGFVHLVLDGLVVSEDLREHADSVEGWPKNDGDLLDESVSGEKHRVLLGPVLDQLLVLVELLQGVEVSNIDVQASLFGFLLMLSVGDKADLKVLPGNVGESDSAGESLVLFGVVILESNLELDGLSEANLLVGSLGVFVGLHPLDSFGDVSL